MNPITATVDTQISSYSSIGSVNALDDVKLTLEVLTNGVIDTPWTSPIFELIGVKSDENEVRQTDGFEVLDLATRKVKIKLKEQFLTRSGMLKLQLIIKDSGRTSSTVFYLCCGQSLEQDLISIRDVEVFDQLDLYAAQGFNLINEAIEITGELKKEMTEINNEASECEKERQASELTRNQRELVRVDNEEDRVVNELGRIQNEEIRVTNEEERVSSENTRITNENNRRIHENTRISQEVARQEAERQRNAIFEENENIRSEQENTRIKSENERKKKFSAWEERETIRLKSEENRILQEQKRVENEEDRKRQELTRQNQEEYRQRTYTQFNEAEASRVNNEIQREASEKQRQQAETNRDAAYQRREEKRDVEYGKAEEVRNNAFEQNEANRQNEYTVAERERVESEELRKGRERDRANAETKRQEAETARANAESGRVDRFNKEIEKAKTTMATATSNVNTAISQADATMQSIEQRAEDCLPAIEKFASAKVDYMGNEHDSIKDAMDANVEFVLDEVNTVHYEGQTITATDTIERQVRSAILKGQTLVNLAPKFNDSRWIKNGSGNPSVIKTDDYIEINVTSAGSAVVDFKDMTLFELNTDYTFIINILENTFSSVALTDFSSVSKSLTIGCNKFKLTSNGSTDLSIRIGHTGHLGANSKLRISNIVVLEGDYTNVDIPYFEGMKSVKMPVLTTTGKNLALINNIENIQTSIGDVISRKIFDISLKPNTKYSIKTDAMSQGIDKSRVRIYSYKEDGTYKLITDYFTRSGTTSTFTTPNELLKYFVTAYSFDDNFTTITGLHIEEGETIPSYEPYKSNILTVNEQLELRGIGEGSNRIEDELNLMTGELTERIGEVVLDGSENWTTHTYAGTQIFKTIVRGIRDNMEELMCNRINNSNIIDNNTFHFKATSNGIEIMLDDSSITTIDNFKQYISLSKENPIIIQYQLKTKSIKTVDLNGQKVYSYDGTTHYSCSAAEGSLIPTLSIDVPTNLPALVSRQRVTIESQKEQIITLEQENEQLIAQNEVQDTDIALNQDAINFMLFAPTAMSLAEKNKGTNTMAAYLANQILKGRLDYTLVISRYSEFKEDIDTILISEGKQDLIIKGDEK